MLSSTTMSSSTMDPHHHVRTIISLHYHILVTIMFPALPWSSWTMTHTTMWYCHFPDSTDMVVTIMLEHYMVVLETMVRTIMSLHVRNMIVHGSCGVGNGGGLPWSSSKHDGDRMWYHVRTIISLHYGHGGVGHGGGGHGSAGNMMVKDVVM